MGNSAREWNGITEKSDLALEMMPEKQHFLIWLVVEPYPSEKYESQLGLLFYMEKIKKKFQSTNHHQPVVDCTVRSRDFTGKVGLIWGFSWQLKHKHSIFDHEKT